MREKRITICRCEDISLDEIRNAIADGYDDFEELKRFLRVGMGPCGGRTCLPMIRRELANIKGIPLGKLDVPTVRPPMQVTTFAAVFAGKEGAHNE
jgi:bacterioferritin-associated ferredoxin